MIFKSSMTSWGDGAIAGGIRWSGRYWLVLCGEIAFGSLAGPVQRTASIWTSARLPKKRRGVYPVSQPGLGIGALVGKVFRETGSVPQTLPWRGNASSQESRRSTSAIWSFAWVVLTHPPTILAHRATHDATQGSVSQSASCGAPAPPELFPPAAMPLPTRKAHSARIWLSRNRCGLGAAEAAVGTQARAVQCPERLQDAEQLCAQGFGKRRAAELQPGSGSLPAPLTAQALQSGSVLTPKAGCVFPTCRLPLRAWFALRPSRFLPQRRTLRRPQTLYRGPGNPEAPVAAGAAKLGRRGSCQCSPAV